MKVETTRIEYDPQLDGTPAAHPAWLRGNDHGVEAVVALLMRQMDGEKPFGITSEKLQALRNRISVVMAEHTAALKQADELEEAWGDSRVKWAELVQQTQAERDAAAARAEAAEKERDDWRTTAGATHITLTMERNNAIAQRDAARAALKEWPDAYSAFLGAFDTPIARRRDSCDFATDARHRMAAFNEIARAALASGEKA